MNELDKMKSGQAYHLTAPEVLYDQEAGIRWTDEYAEGNNLDRPAQLLRLKMHLGALGDYASVEPGFSCQHGPNIQIGHHFFAQKNLTIIDSAAVTIGDYVQLGPGCLITSIQLPRSKKERRERLARALPVTIGSDVALGARVTVLPGVTIGDNVIVEAGAVVASDLPANCVAAGIPARKIADLDPQN